MHPCLSETEIRCGRLWHYASFRNVRWMNDPEVTRFLRKRGRLTLWQAANYYLTNRRTHLLLAVYHRSRHVGNSGYFDPNTGAPELRICIGERQIWGKGVGSDAISLMARSAAEKPWREVWLNVAETNPAAIRVYEKAGFVEVERGLLVVDGIPQVRMSLDLEKIRALTTR